MHQLRKEVKLQLIQIYSIMVEQWEGCGEGGLARKGTIQNKSVLEMFQKIKAKLGNSFLKQFIQIWYSTPHRKQFV